MSLGSLPPHFLSTTGRERSPAVKLYVDCPRRKDSDTVAVGIVDLRITY
jgi:hypothetical protein